MLRVGSTYGARDVALPTQADLAAWLTDCFSLQLICYGPPGIGVLNAFERPSSSGVVVESAAVVDERCGHTVSVVRGSLSKRTVTVGKPVFLLISINCTATGPMPLAIQNWIASVFPFQVCTAENASTSEYRSPFKKDK